MDITQIINLIGDFGFPVVLAVYLLVRLEKKVDKLIKVVNQMDQLKELKEK